MPQINRILSWLFLLWALSIAIFLGVIIFARFKVGIATCIRLYGANCTVIN